MTFIVIGGNYLMVLNWLYLQDHFSIISFQPLLLQSSRHQNPSPKRREDGEQIFYSSVSAKKSKLVRTVIVELADLEKDYLLVLARLKLVQHGKNETIVVGKLDC